MFRQQHISVTGFQLVDAEDTVEQRVRGNAIPAFATVAQEKNAGYGNWQIMRPGDPANMMWWPLDPTVPPSRGAVAGSYSYAFPARLFDPVTFPGFFLPLAIPNQLDTDYELTLIEEADPKDWIILGTTKHGDRRKLAFRSGNNPLLIADHRSQIAPELSSIVHDGRGLSHDRVRKAGLHTAWEVREYAIPGAQGVYSQTSSQKPPLVPDRYALSWVGDTAPDSTGFCNIGFGGETGLFSHLVSGPFKNSFKEKHWLGDTNDGPEISGGLSTKAYFVGSKMPFTAPLDFEEKIYPDPAESTYEYKVYLWYDPKSKHSHYLKNGLQLSATNERPGLWRWFTRIPIGETPKCSPTKDYSTTDANENPRRTFSEDSRAIMHKKLIGPGFYFSPRPNILRGRIPGTVTRHI